MHQDVEVTCTVVGLHGRTFPTSRAGRWGRWWTPRQHRQPDGFGRGHFPRPLRHGVGGLDANGPVGLVVNPVLNSVEGEEMAARATHLVGLGDELIGGFHRVSPARVWGLVLTLSRLPSTSSPQKGQSVLMRGLYARMRHALLAADALLAPMLTC